MHKFILKVPFIFFVIIIIHYSAKSQYDEGADTWLLEKQVSLEGLNYSNGIPSKIVLSNSINSVIIETFTQNDKGWDTIKYNLKSDGSKLETFTTSGKKKTVHLERLSNTRDFIITEVVAGEGMTIAATYMTQLHISEEGNEIKLIRECRSPVNSKNYRMTGVYGLLGSGVNFGKGLSWQQIKDRAKQENKYIFLDCYASWCMPCKKMDRLVYPLMKVSNYLNTRFVTMKIQMDSSRYDEKEIKDRYVDAINIKNRYSVNAYPSILFFSPNGELVHRVVGYHSADDLIDAAESAIDSNRQYYTLLEKYNKGQFISNRLNYLAILTKRFGNAQLALKIAQDYKKMIIDKMDSSAVLRKNVIDFVCREFPSLMYMDGAKGEIFHLFINNSRIVDSVMGQSGFASYYVKRIIKKEEVDRKLWLNNETINSEPKWREIEESISNKYGLYYGESIITISKIEFYKKVGSWRAYSDLIDSTMRKYPPTSNGKEFSHSVEEYLSDEWTLNVICWDVFSKCNDERVLRRAITWINKSIELARKSKVDWISQVLDTKANLLYKLGKVKLAVICEEEAASIEEEIVLKEKGNIQYTSEYRNTIRKMKNGIPTW